MTTRIAVALLAVLACGLAFAQTAPYDASTAITGITFNTGTITSAADGSDNWPVTWCDDGHQYTSFGDGGGFGGTNDDGRVSMGVGRFEGGLIGWTGYNINGGKNPESGNTNWPDVAGSGGKSLGIICIDLSSDGGQAGTIYMFRNGTLSGEGSYVQTQLYKSLDHGETWSFTGVEWTGSPGFFSPSFVQFGQDYAGGGAYVYVIAPTNQNGVWEVQPDGEILLFRVPKDDMETQGSWEYFSGTAGSPAWSSSLGSAAPVFADAVNGVMRTSLSYNSPLDRYILTTQQDTRFSPDYLMGIYDAPEPWGPWTTVWLGNPNSGISPSLQIGGKTVFWNWSNKWLSADGLTMALVYTGDGADELGVTTATLTTSAVCGDNALDFGEECDTDQLDSETCVTRGYDYGILQCKKDCTFSEAYCITESVTQPVQTDNTWVPAADAPPLGFMGAADASYVNDAGSTGSPPGYPYTRGWFGMSFDKTAQRTLVIGGSAEGVSGCTPGYAYVNDVWELWWTGSTWQWNQRKPDLETGTWMEGTDNHVVYYDGDSDVTWIAGGTCQATNEAFGYYDYTTNSFVESVMLSAANTAPDVNNFDPAAAWGNWGGPGHGDAWSGFWAAYGESPPVANNVTSLFDTSSGTVTSDHWLSGVTVGPDNDLRTQVHEAGVYIPSTKKFMFFGGRDASAVATGVDDTFEYDPVANTWEHVCGTSIADPCGPLPRYKHVAVYNNKHDVVMMHGGSLAGTNEAYSDVWIYDPQDQAWTLLLDDSVGTDTANHGGAYDSYNDVYVWFAGTSDAGTGVWEVSTLRYTPDTQIQIDDVLVVEPASSARTDEPVTAGLPFQLGTDVGTLHLWDGETEIPLQVTTLDSSDKSLWALLHFQTTVGSGATKTLNLRRGAGSVPAHANPVTITDSGTAYTVDTGATQFTIPHDTFDLITTVAGTEQTYSAQTSNISITARISGTTGTVASGTQTPITATWEYGSVGGTNLLQATLRIDGRYGTVGSTLCPTATNCLEYTTRLTFYAGKSYVRVEHYIRNEFQSNETHAKIETATLVFGAGSGATVTLASSGTTARRAYADDANGFTWELIPATIYTATSSSTNAGMVLYDQSHHGGTLLVDFATAGSSSETTIDSPLLGLWSTLSRYADDGDMTVEDWGTWAEEDAIYDDWGWDQTGVTAPSDAHRANSLNVTWLGEDSHNDQEQDDVWANLNMFLRIGQADGRGFFDRAQEWARYYQREYAGRSRGYEYAWDQSWECYGEVNCNDLDRPLQQPSNLTSADTTAQALMQSGKHDMYSGWGGDHTWGWGLIDYYHITGDIDAKEAAIDIAEAAERVVGSRVEDLVWPGGRMVGRQFLLITRVAEVTDDATWITRMNHVGDIVMSSLNWELDAAEGWEIYAMGSASHDARYGAGSYAAGLRSLSYIETPPMVLAFDRYLNSPDRSYGTLTCGPAKDQQCTDAYLEGRIVGHAEYLYRYGLGSQADVCVGCTPETPLDDFGGSFPAIDTNDNTAYVDPWSTSGRPSSYSDFATLSWIDILTRGYVYDADTKYLNRARYLWHRASKYTSTLPWPDCGAMTEETAAATLCRYLFEGFQGDHHISNGETNMIVMLFAHGLESTGSGEPVVLGSPSELVGGSITGGSIE